MKKYQSPSLKKVLFWTKDVIAVSGDETNIVSTGDSQGAAEIIETTWNDSWD